MGESFEEFKGQISALTGSAAVDEKFLRETWDGAGCKMHIAVNHFLNLLDQDKVVYAGQGGGDEKSPPPKSSSKPAKSTARKSGKKSGHHHHHDHDHQDSGGGGGGDFSTFDSGPGGFGAGGAGDFSSATGGFGAGGGGDFSSAAGGWGPMGMQPPPSGHIGMQPSMGMPGQQMPMSGQMGMQPSMGMGGPCPMGGPMGNPAPLGGPPTMGGPPAMGGPPPMGGPPQMGGPPPMGGPAPMGGPPPMQPPGGAPNDFAFNPQQGEVSSQLQETQKELAELQAQIEALSKGQMPQAASLAGTGMPPPAAPGGFGAPAGYDESDSDSDNDWWHLPAPGVRAQQGAFGGSAPTPGGVGGPDPFQSANGGMMPNSMGGGIGAAAPGMGGWGQQPMPPHNTVQNWQAPAQQVPGPGTYGAAW